MPITRLVVTVCLAVLAAAQSPADRYKQGHSRHGEAFDSGPRTRPAEMSDIGRAHFKITAKNPEVQKWFDQGNTLLHSFWDYEAERAFRWALKLEPDNAMAYWGLARAASADEQRARAFLAEAVKRKHQVTDRERLYIEALEKSQTFNPFRDRAPENRERNQAYRETLETICVKYPDDVEAKAMLALTNMWSSSRYGTELIIREILSKQPDHPGAHHYRIHNWNYHEPEQALASCRRYGDIAPGIGHALHMPGHVYATIGMWHEAAISMDAATRVEVRRMHEQFVFPFNYWNYGHNRNYLCFIQEQLGMAAAAIAGARELVAAPLDPKRNSDGSYSPHSQGIRALLRALVKFERWDDLMAAGAIPWRDVFHDKMLKSYAETRVWIARGNKLNADKSAGEFAALAKDSKDWERQYKVLSQELNGRLALMRGDRLAGIALLAKAAEDQAEDQKHDNDPPFYPENLYVTLGREYLSARSPDLALAAFDKALEVIRNDIFAMAGKMEALHALGRSQDARATLARLLFIASDADKGLPALERAKATGVRAEPADSSPAPQRRYSTVSLDRYGPPSWQPQPAPDLSAADHANKPVTLKDYTGSNVMLVFYLGRECLHCMNQLHEIAKKTGDWKRLNTVVLAVSPNKPEDNAKYLKTLSLPGVRVLSDPRAANARRFRSYDDFEDLEVHSTILIDKNGRVHWAHTGGEPFGDMAFLVKQLERMNQ
jgi:peroxiredoxin